MNNPVVLINHKSDYLPIGKCLGFFLNGENLEATIQLDMNGISFDEAAFEPHLVMIYQEVLNLRRLSTGGPLHFIGTPSEGINDYSELWEKGNPDITTWVFFGLPPSFPLFLFFSACSW